MEYNKTNAKLQNNNGFKDKIKTQNEGLGKT